MTETKMQLVDWLDDLCVRFIINLPQEELESSERICFQIEEAQWFYEDFIRPIDPSLPQMHLSEFASRLLKHCPLTAGYSDDLHALAFKKFLAYKTRVPVRGAILLDHDMDKVLLVKGYKKNATWSFPRGKINKDEDDLVCAIREVWEETGYDIEKAGLVPLNRDVHYIDVTMREQHLRMFVFRSVPLDTPFEPQTRKEISKIQWYTLNALPIYNNKRRSQHAATTDVETISSNKLYMVAPFLGALKKWIHHQRKLDGRRSTHHHPPLPRDLQDVLSDAPEDSERELQSSAPNGSDELRRMLSLAPVASTTLPLSTRPAIVNQGNDLLAMLRGSPFALAPPVAANPPRTPMEQILAQPNQPDSPHVQHVRHSPQATRQPPPPFPLSSNSQHVQDVARSMYQLDLNGSPHSLFANMGFSNQQQQFAQASQQHSNFPSHPMQDQMNQQRHSSQFSGPSQVMPSMQPQGHGAIAHGPAAPKASQLPPPSMTHHTMSLLNAFKTPSQQYQQHQQYVQQLQQQHQHLEQQRQQHEQQQQQQLGQQRQQHEQQQHEQQQHEQQQHEQQQHEQQQHEQQQHEQQQHEQQQKRQHYQQQQVRQQQTFMQRQMQPPQAQSFPRQVPNMAPTDGYPTGNGLLQSGMSTSMNPQHAPSEQLSPMVSSRSTHQASLLNLFRSPAAANATPANHENERPSTEAPQRTASLQLTQPVQPQQQTIDGPTAELPKQRSATLAMMTRTLPKAKTAPSPSSPHPKVSYRGGVAPAPISPAKQAVQQARINSINRATPDGQQTMATTDTSKPPMAILSRPASKSGPGLATPSNAAPSPRRTRPSKNADQAAASNFTILQRPSTDKPVDSPRRKQVSSPSVAQTEAPMKPFQPQLLRRPKTDETAVPNVLPTSQTGSPAPPGGDQKNALLALFAKSEQGRVKSVDLARNHSGGPLSSGSASPLPTDPSAFRSRIASNASVVSNGGESGMKSPSTPVEAKGFLLDYLNGVVKGEQYRGAKRPSQA